MVDATAGSSLGRAPLAQRPYAPSPFDRLFDWVDAQPYPYWLYYLGFSLALLALSLIVYWQSGGTSLPGTFAVVITLNFAYDLILMEYQDRQGVAALDQFQPLIDAPPEAIAELRYRISTMPFGGTLIAMAVGALLGLVTIVLLPLDVRLQVMSVPNTELAIWFFHGLYVAICMLAAVYVYHVRVQYQVMRDILALYTQVDVLNLGPIYAFSRMSAVTAISLIAIAYAWFASVPTVQASAVVLVWTGFFLLISTLTFVLPLLTTHQVLNDEKQRLLAENAQRIEDAAAELHRRVDGERMTDMDNVFKTLHSLEIEHQALRRIPVWPWQPETARLVIAALMFPVVLWLVQSVLRRMLEP